MADDIANLIPTTEDTETLLSYRVPFEDTEKYRQEYEDQVMKGEVDNKTKFQYSWCLVHSSGYKHFKMASVLLEELFKDGSEEMKRDTLFYLALVETKQKHYCTAKKYIEAFLSVEPNNVQAIQLKQYIEMKLKKDGITGMALVGAATVFGGVAAVVFGTAAVVAALGFALKRRKL